MKTYGQVKDHRFLLENDRIRDTLEDYFPTLPKIWGEGETWATRDYAIMNVLRYHFYDHRLLYPWGEEEEDPPYMSELELRAESLLIAHSQRVNRLIETTLLEYNPIENYNMTETETESTEGTSDGSGGGEGNSVTREYPFDVGVARPVASSESGTSSTSHAETTGSRNRSLSRSGNIGVTTSQQMLLSERDVAVNAIGWIIEILSPLFLLDDNDI